MFRFRLPIFGFIAIAAAFGVMFLSSWPQQPVFAQAEQIVECGEIIESEFRNNEEIQSYALRMSSRDSFAVSIETVGDFLQTAIFLYGPTGLEIKREGASSAPSIESGILSARGNYRIDLRNYNYGIGEYTMFVSCTVNGQLIEAGDIAQPTPTLAPLPTETPRPALPDEVTEFDSIGFPGLAPVDFSDVITVPLLDDEAVTGIMPIGNEILGFVAEVEAGDVLSLDYERVSGNMNLGLVVLSENNEVFFQASLVTSETLATQFTLPEAGEYTIGVFRIALVEPDEVEPTVFRLRGAVGAVEERE